MSAVPIVLLLGLGGLYVLSQKKPVSTQAQKAASEVPADANALLGNMLSPSNSDPNALADIFKAFVAAVPNQVPGEAKFRLMQYALATFLKILMLSKGASPNVPELQSIAYAPTEGGQGLLSYGDIENSAQVDIASALNDSYSDIGGMGQYIGDWAQEYNIVAAGPKRRRLLAFILATKAKQLALQAGSYHFPSNVYFAIANLRTEDIPTTTPANSIAAI